MTLISCINRLKKLFQVRTCVKCNKGLGEISFASKSDELCNVCRHYNRGKEIICCRHSITLYHGEPELCSICGTPLIMWGASIYQGTPFISPPKMSKYEGYIPLILYQKDGFEEYMDRVEHAASKITNKKVAEFYRKFYSLNADCSKRWRDSIDDFIR